MSLSTAERVAGMYRAIVVDNDDPEGLLRVRVQIPTLTGTAVSDWASPAIPSTAGAAAPNVQDPIWVSFEDGDIDKPVYMGTWKANVDRNDPTIGLGYVISGGTNTYETAETFWAARQVGNPYPRFSALSNGTMYWGTGSGPPDVTLSYATGILNLTGALATSSYVTAGGGVNVGGSPSANYTGEVQFTGVGPGGSYAFTSLATGAPQMYFDFRGTGNTGSWFWRNGTGAGVTRMSLTGVGALTVVSNITSTSGSLYGASVNLTGPGGTPRVYWKSTDSAADAKVWDVYAGGNTLIFRTINDAENAASPWLTVTRAANVPSIAAWTIPHTITPAAGLTGTRPLLINAPSGLSTDLFLIQLNSVSNFRVDNTGIVRAIGGNSGFGVGALGATGTYMRIGDQGDAAGAYVIADGTPTNINAYVRAKGTGAHLFDDAAGAARLKLFAAAGQMGVPDFYVGNYAYGTGTNVSRWHLQSATGTVHAFAEGDGANQNMVFHQKGSGAFYFQDAGATVSYAAIFSTGVQASGTDHYFGPYAFGVGTAVSRLHFSFDSGAVYLTAEGDGADRSIINGIKGAGLFRVFGGANEVLRVSSLGQVIIYGNTAAGAELNDWPNSSFAIRRSDNFASNGITMISLGYRSDPTYITDDSVPNIRIYDTTQAASASTSASTTQFRIGGPGPLWLGAGNFPGRVQIDNAGTTYWKNASSVNTVIIDPGNNRLQTQGDQSGLIGYNTAGASQYLIGLRNDVTGSTTTPVLYSYNNPWAVYGGLNIIAPGIFKASGNDHYFGPYAFGGTGVSRLHLQWISAGEYRISAEGDGANVQLTYNTQGVGSHIWLVAGVQKAALDSAGNFTALGTIHKFGRGAQGASAIYAQLSEDGVNAFLTAAGTPGQIDMILRPQGASTGSVRLQNSAGTSMVVAGPSGVTLAHGTWSPVTFQNTWSNYGAPWEQAKYILDPQGWVHIKGLVQSAGSPTTAIFTLPSGFRPLNDELFMVNCLGGEARIDISASTGAVTLSGYLGGGTAAYVGLSGITFATF